MKSLITSLCSRRPVTKRSTSTYRPQLQELEDRRTPACTFFHNILTSSLSISGTTMADTVTISVSGSQLHVDYQSMGEAISGRKSFPLSSVTNLAFYGYAGNDTLRNFSSVKITAMGGEGNDTLIDGIAASTLYGENGIDTLQGGQGNDVLYGGNDIDYLYGDGGEDRLYGEAGADQLFGGDYADTLSGGTGNDTLRGESGRDLIFGDADQDYLYGGWDDDTLYGGSGHDILMGEFGTDRLYGETGNDFVDAGSASEFAHGGTTAGEINFNPYILTVSGATFNDVFQVGGPTCWVDSAISSVAHKGIDLSTRITYLGNFMFRINLYNFPTPGSTSMSWTSEDIYFNGTMYPMGDVKANPIQISTNGFSETWVILTHRAILQGVSRWDPTQSVTTPHSGGVAHPLMMLTGRTADWAVPNRTQMMGALSASKHVVVCTGGTSASTFSSKLVGSHCYNVLSIYSLGGTWYLQIRNPWGYDGGATVSGDGNDGLITLSWSELTGSTNQICIC